MTIPDWEIRRLTVEDAAELADFTQRQGWPHGKREWRRMIELEPQGCLGAVREGRLIGTATAICYGKVLAWIGMVQVDAAFRRRGVATSLMEACMGYLRAQGVARIMLDASEMGRPLYERLGFRALHRVQRWQGQATEFFGPRARRLQAGDMSAVIAFDERRFGAPRGRVLLRLQAEFPRLGWIDRDTRGRLQGYLLAQRMSGVVSIGPWVHDSPEGATVLLNTALGAVRGETVNLSIEDRNPAAAAIVHDHALRVAGYNTRMIWGDAAPPRDEPMSLFAVASPALG